MRTTDSVTLKDDTRDGFRSTADAVVLFAIWSVLFVMPLIMGGRHPWGRVVFVAMVAIGLTAMVFSSHNRGIPRGSLAWLYGLLLVAVFLGILQITPLPAQWVAQVVPALDLWFGDSIEGQVASVRGWRTISLHPQASKEVLAVFIGAVGWIWLVAGYAQDIERRRRVIRWVAFSAVAIAMLGLAQYLFNNGRFLWFYSHPTRTTWFAVKGPFANENHFAHLLVIGGLALWCIAISSWSRCAGQTTESEVRVFGRKISWQVLNTVLALSATLVIFGIILAKSRAGWCLLAIAAIWCGWSTLNIASRRHRERRKFDWSLLMTRTTTGTIVAVSALIGAAWFIFRTDLFRIAQNLRSIAIQCMSFAIGESRWSIWQADVAALHGAGLLGTGGGTHKDVYPMFYEGRTDVEYLYSENGFLQIAMEYGVVGVMLVVAIVILTGLIIWRSPSSVESSPDANPSSVAGGRHLQCGVWMVVVLHGSVDFVWWIPGCFVGAVALMIASWPESPGEGEATPKLSSLPFLGQWRRLKLSMASLPIAMAGLIATAVLWPAAHASLHQEQFLKLDLNSQQIKKSSKETNSLDQRIAALERVIRCHPAHGQSRVWLAELYIERFDRGRLQRNNTMAVGDLREAIDDNQFESAASVRDWLTRACGDDTRDLFAAADELKAVGKINILSSRQYYRRAELAFLDPNTVELVSTLREQALQLRPRDPVLLLSRGHEEFTNGHTSSAWFFWRRAARESTVAEMALFELLVPRIGVDQFLDNMRSNTSQASRLYRWCRRKQNGQTKDAAKMYAGYVLRDLCDNSTVLSAEQLLLAFECAQQIEDHLGAVVIGEHFIEMNPYHVSLRRHLFLSHLKCRNWNAAKRHMNWWRVFGSGKTDLADMRQRFVQSRQASAQLAKRDKS